MWLVPQTGSGLDAFASEMLANIEQVEVRKRARKADDHRNFDRLVRCVVANLVRATIEPPMANGWLAVEYHNGRAKPSVYECKAFGKPWNALAILLEALGFINRRDGLIPTDGHRGQAPSIRPTAKFAGLVENIPLDEIAFARATDEPLLVVSENVWTSGAFKGSRVKKREWHEYEQTSQTRQLNEQVARINAHIQTAEIGIEGDHGKVELTGGSSISLRRNFFLSATLNDQDQSLWFKSGGRLFGGFWQNMRKGDRAQLRVDGQRLAEIDFSSMNAHIAYVIAQSRPPSGDLYAIPGLEGYRADVKMLFNALLSKPQGQSTVRWPQSIHDAAAKLSLDDAAGAHRPAGSIVRSKIKPKDAVRLIEEYHIGIAHLFKAGRIGEIQYLESETLITALEMLRVDGVVALPIHDAILIPASSLEVGKRAMDNAAFKVLGISIPTSHGLL
ncbi:hypothetical protein GVN24_15970 [Rhizobium sp. CRIBSB]|nr:hypothetical protein [Rhizobium sp. CRIBSB]